MLLTNVIIMFFSMLFFYYNIANCLNRKTFQPSKVSFFLLNTAILSLTLSYVLNGGNDNLIGRTTDYTLYFISEYILSFYYEHSILIISGSIFLLFINRFIKSSIIKIYLELLALCILYYFIIGIFFLDSGHLDNTPVFYLMQEITGSKLTNISELMVNDLVIKINIITYTLLLAFLSLSFSNVPSIYFMTFPKYFFYKVKLPILMIQVKIIQKGINDYEKTIIKIRNIEKRFKPNFQSTATLKDLENKKAKKIKEKEELLNKIDNHKKEHEHTKKNMLTLHGSDRRFRIFKFINKDLYIFMMKNKKYLLIFAIFLEIFNNFIEFTNQDKNFDKFIISQTYHIFTLFVILILFHKRNILEFIAEYKNKVIFNMLLITLMLLIQDYFYKIIEVNILNALIITILYSMRDSILNNKSNTFLMYVTLIFYTIHNILIISMTGNVPAKEAIVFFNSIIIIMMFDKKIIEKNYVIFFEKISKSVNKLKK